MLHYVYNNIYKSLFMIPVYEYIWQERRVATKINILSVRVDDEFDKRCCPILFIIVKIEQVAVHDV
jgi:hypothetical protein